MIKCVIWDLDNTLWHGILNEGEPLTLNPAAVSTIRESEKRGVFHSIASRNAEEPAVKQLEALGLGGVFLFPRIDPYLVKSAAMRDIAAHFNIGLDALAFVDDDPFERYEVKRFTPEVALFAADETDVLLRAVSGQPPPAGDRGGWMRRRESRLAAEAAFTGTRAEFLQECHMELTVRRARPGDLPRVRELAGRARQINTAYGRESDGDIVYVCELNDIFGGHGLVGGAMLRRLDTLSLELFCVSCRVEGRGVAAAFLGAVLRREAEGAVVRCRCTDIRGGYAPVLLKSMGFRVIQTEGGRLLLQLTPPFTFTEVSWIRTINI